VTPILVMLVVLVADFGRIFAVSLTMEAAARDAAEVMANSYLSSPPGAPGVLLSQPAPPGDPAYYAPLHALAAKTVCAETSDLPNTAFDQGTGTCAGMPLIQACIHDSQDTNCSVEAQGATIPAACGDLATAPSNSHAGSGTPRWAEVRVCYRFTAILNLPILSFGDFWLQKTRTFVIPCYFVLGSTECG
jgi:hypothetical protein